MDFFSILCGGLCPLFRRIHLVVVGAKSVENGSRVETVGNPEVLQRFKQGTVLLIKWS